MKVINGLGGGGSTFILNALDRYGYKNLWGKFDTYRLKKHLERTPKHIKKLKFLLSLAGLYTADFHVLKRPDSFWTDWPYNPSSQYDPQHSNFAAQIVAQRDYILETVDYRSAGLPIQPDDLSTESLPELVGSYVKQLQEIESEIAGEIVLVSGHWGEYGILQELGIETIYLIRDPFNSLISHSKEVRHEVDYLKRGLTDINSVEWIETYLSGPHHYWIQHAECALNHENATIIRYHHFAADWQQVEDLPDISAEFTYTQNSVAEVLTTESIDYIYGRTREICHALEFDEIYDQIRNLKRDE